MKITFPATIKTKLAISFLAIIIASGFGAIFIGIYVIHGFILNQAYELVKKHLDTAEYILDQDVDNIASSIQRESESPEVIRSLRFGRVKMLTRQLDRLKKKLNLDILHVTDISGRTVSIPRGVPLLELPCMRHVIETQKPCSGTELLPPHILKEEGEELRRRTEIKVLDTPHQRKVVKTSERRAFAHVAASPLVWKGRLIGVIYGAHILNNSPTLVDRIKHLLYQDVKIEGLELGTVTIFLDDVRIATNVKDKNGIRTIGTRVSEDVYRQVVLKRKKWVDKAFVVNTWYISAYQPIYNISRDVVGILYVGVLDEKYQRLKRKSTSYFIVLMVLVGLFSIVLATYLIPNIVSPIRELVNASREVATGNLHCKVERHYDGEMGQLIYTFNLMIDAINERDRKLKENTQKQIFQSEKLASLGRLASGVAHEINNPLTGVLTYSNILLEEIKDAEHKEDLQIIVRETLRCRSIVRELLDFARESRLEIQEACVNHLISESLALLGKTYRFQNIEIEKDLDLEIPALMVDVNQIKSVISNLAVNAADAMPEGGHLYIATRFESKNNTILIEITDNGTGISEKNIEKIFDPFFTTKATGEGTGLGLAVTYGIIERHGGTIRVISEEGRGTTFIIELPIK